MKNSGSDSCKRPYELGKRLEQMGRTKAAVLASARVQLESGGMREFSMESLAKASGVTRQTIHNLFGTRSGLLETLFDQIARDAGMERMREVMMTSDPHAMLDRFIAVFSNFWAKNSLLLKRIHGIAAIDPEFGEAVRARNHRRRTAATRVIERLDSGVQSKITNDKSERVACLVALTSFEFFDALVDSLGTVEAAEEQLPGLIKRAIRSD
ncbi:TetR/AcrR family transcriptional regulator [Telmatobacter sp. DSM 110680]|uniref:TetR/AcrR family transcriptional regulator n=1 Tax=Telmatobacter sp. DSM 110680 TaxID=3036704 RepID=A0AAU7DEX7_9BACT